MGLNVRKLKISKLLLLIILLSLQSCKSNEERIMDLVVDYVKMNAPVLNDYIPLNNEITEVGDLYKVNHFYRAKVNGDNLRCKKLFWIHKDLDRVEEDKKGKWENFDDY